MPLAEALVAGGLSCVEITFRTPAAREGLAAIRRGAPGDPPRGGHRARRRAGRRRRSRPEPTSPWRPGRAPTSCGPRTSEDCRCCPARARRATSSGARSLGLRLLKFFPAEPIGGAAYLRALCGPYRDVRFVPTGSITPATLPELPRHSPGRRLRRQLDGQAGASPRGRVGSRHRTRRRGRCPRYVGAMNELVASTAETSAASNSSRSAR